MMRTNVMRMVAATVAAGGLAGSYRVSPSAAQGHAMSAAAQAGAVIEIPLSVEGGRLVVPVTGRDGTEYRFALTTGNPMTILTESTASRLGEDKSGLNMGGIPIETGDAVTLPDAQLESDDGTKLAGMVGGATLSAYDILVDVPNGRLLMKSPQRSVDWGEVALSPPSRLQVYHGVVLGLEVQLSGMDYRATLDLGTPSVILSSPAGAQLGIEGTGHLALGLGATSLADVPVRVTDLGVFQQWDPAGTGFVLVGAAIAYDCAISISWAHSEIRTCAR